MDNTSRPAKLLEFVHENGMLPGKAVEKLLGVDHHKVDHLIATDTRFPRPYRYGHKPGRGWRFFRRAELMAWLEGQKEQLAA